MLATTEDYVRRVLHEFNESGVGALESKWSGGPAVGISPQARDEVCRIARCKPAELGLVFTVWSLSKLADYLARNGAVDRISTEAVRKILKANGIIFAGG